MAVQPSPWQRSQGNVCLSFEEGLAGRQDSTFRIKESSLSLWDPCHTRTDVDPERRGLMLQHLWVPIPPGAAAAPRPQRGSQGAPVPVSPCSRGSLSRLLSQSRLLWPHNPACQGLIIPATSSLPPPKRSQGSLQSAHCLLTPAPYYSQQELSDIPLPLCS